MSVAGPALSVGVARAALERNAGRIFAVIAVCGWAILLWMGRGLTFFSDEWAFIETRSLFDVQTWFAPHNEHWSTVPIVIYRLLMEVVGLRTYVPYLAVLIGLHVAVAAAVFVLLRRWTGPLAALGGGTLVLFLGSGFENLYWAFQIGFVGTIAAGLWMVWLLDGPAGSRRAAAVVGLLVVSLATSGLALVFLGIAAILMLMRPDWRRFAPGLLVPLLVYAAWYVLVGNAGLAADRDPLSLERVLQAPWFVAEGLENAVGAITGVGSVLAGIVVVLLLLGLLDAVVRGHRVPAPTIALSAGLVLEYALIALTRAGVTFGQSDYTRYTYLGAILVLLAIAAMAGSLPMPSVRWRRQAIFVGATLVLELAIVLNVQLLVAGRDFFLVRAQFTRALIAEAVTHDGSDGVDLARSLVAVPSPDSLRQIGARYGLPTSDALVPGDVTQAPDWIQRLATLRFQGFPVGP